MLSQRGANEKKPPLNSSASMQLAHWIMEEANAVLFIANASVGFCEK